MLVPSELDEATINYLKGKKVIALLDPDEAGKTIRNKLNNLIRDVINVEIDINKCNRGRKNGVAVPIHLLSAMMRSMDMKITVSNSVWITGTITPPLKMVPQMFRGAPAGSPPSKFED